MNGLGCSPWSGEGGHPGKGGRDRAREGERAGKRRQEIPQTESGTERGGAGAGGVLGSWADGVRGAGRLSPATPAARGAATPGRGGGR